MTRLRLAAISAALLLAVASTPAKADTLDLANFTCGQLAQANKEGGAENAKGLAGILYWIAGYHASDGHGTIVDFEQLLAGFDKVFEHCNDNPDDKVLTVAGDRVGVEEPSDKAVDLALITCEKVLKTPPKQADGLGQILMWLSGYQAGYASDTTFDATAFTESAGQIGEYCAANPHIGLYAASEKFMSPTE